VVSAAAAVDASKSRCTSPSSAAFTNPNEARVITGGTMALGKISNPKLDPILECITDVPVLPSATVLSLQKEDVPKIQEVSRTARGKVYMPLFPRSNWVAGILQGLYLLVAHGSARNVQPC
jgi:hypothetical protein